MGEDRCRLRREQELPPALGVVEWLDADPITGQRQPAGESVPVGRSEHAFPFRDGILTLAPERPERNLSVAVSTISRGADAEPRPEIRSVVDLPVMHES